MASRTQKLVKPKKGLFLALTTGVAFLGVLLTTASVLAPNTHRKMTVSSTGFRDGEPIPRQYTCDGQNISPVIAWSGAPNQTASFVLIVDDPDAPSGVWTHWIVFDLPPNTTELPENAASAAGGKQGKNDFKNASYNGPCPPVGKVHRYFFKVFALDAMLNLPAGASRTEVESAMAKHILAQGQLVGTYQRK